MTIYFFENFIIDVLTNLKPFNSVNIFINLFLIADSVSLNVVYD